MSAGFAPQPGALLLQAPIIAAVRAEHQPGVGDGLAGPDIVGGLRPPQERSQVGAGPLIQAVPAVPGLYCRPPYPQVLKQMVGPIIPAR